MTKLLLVYLMHMGIILNSITVLTSIVLIATLFLNIKINPLNKVIDINGILILLGLMQFVIYFGVYFNKVIIESLFVLLTLFSVYLLFSKKITVTLIKNIKERIFFLLLIGAFVSYKIIQSSLGQNSFDTVHYLSMIVENASNAKFSFLQYDTGLDSLSIMQSYDFQSYYYLLSYYLKFLTYVQSKLVSDFFPILMPQVIIFAYLLNIVIYSDVAIRLYEFSKKKFLWLIGIYLLFVLSSYEHTTLSFIGNSFRLGLISLLLIKIYEVIEQRNFTWMKAFEVTLLSSSLISFTSSGLFISIIMLSVFALVFYFKDPNKTIENRMKFLLIFLPIELFALFFLSANNLANFIRVGSLIVIFNSVVLLILSNRFIQIQSILTKHKMHVLASVSAVLYILSAYLWLKGFQPQFGFFEDHSRYDMVWHYFGFNDIEHIVINGLYFSLLIGYFVLAKDSFKYFLLLTIGLFINPFTLSFLYRFMTDTVYYRSFEIVFNPFTFVFMTTFIVNRFNSDLARRILQIFIISIFSVIIMLTINLYDHPSFIPSKDYNPIQRMDNSQYEALNVLNTKIKLENYNRPKVISQIEFIRGFVPNIYTPISNQTLRSLNKYVVNPESSKLLNTFVLRDFVGQEIFNVEPEYDSTCNLLIEDQIDFVILDKEQRIFDDNGDVIPLSFKVRDCGTNIYENDRYILYQFFWR